MTTETQLQRTQMGVTYWAVVDLNQGESPILNSCHWGAWVDADPADRRSGAKVYTTREGADADYAYRRKIIREGEGVHGRYTLAKWEARTEVRQVTRVGDYDTRYWRYALEVTA